MSVIKPKNKGVRFLEKQLNAISYFLHYYEQYLLLKEHNLTYSEVVPNLFKRAMLDNACLIINALFRCGTHGSNNIREDMCYLNLLQNKSGLNKHIEELMKFKTNIDVSLLHIDEKEKALKDILEINLSQKIDEKSLENLMSYRDKIFCHQDDYNPSKEKIYFPIIFDFFENEKALFEFILDVYNITKNTSNFDWTHEYWSDEKITMHKLHFKRVNKIYNRINRHVDITTNIRINKEYKPYDERSRLLSRQYDISFEILPYYAMYRVLRSIKNEELEYNCHITNKKLININKNYMSLFLYAIFSSLLLKIWIILGTEDEKNTHTHYNKLSQELNEFCLQNQERIRTNSITDRERMCLGKIQKKRLEMNSHEIEQLISDIENELKSDRRSIAHANFHCDYYKKFYTNKDELIERITKLLCKIQPLIEMFRVYSDKNIQVNAEPSGGGFDINFDLYIEDLENKFRHYLQIN
jgi:hypothetical protein